MERFAIKIDERVKLSLYNICRLCGIDNRDQVPIIEEPDTTFILDDEPSLCKKIIDCVGIQVETNDRMPQKICTLCVDKINDFYEYREMCKATNMQTRELLGLPPEIKDEKPPTLVSSPQQTCEEIPPGNMKRKRKLKSECINYEEIDDDEIDEKPPKKKFPKNSVSAKSKKLLASRRIIVKRETVKPLPSRILPIREKAIPVSREKPTTLIKEKLIIPPIKEKALREKSASVKEKNTVVKEKAQIMKEKIMPQLVKGKGQLSKEKLQLVKEKLPSQIKDKPTLVKDKTQPVKDKAQIEKLKPLKEKIMHTSSKLPILKEKPNKEKTTLKEKLIPLFEEKIEPGSSKLDMELITLKTPNRRERQRELETKKKRKIQTSQPLDKVKTENLYSCIVCPKEFKTQPEYDIHFFRDHTPNTLEHGCSACREAFYDLQEYRDHQLWHRLSSIPFSCFKCDSHFDRITAYTRHFLTSCVPHIEYNIFDDIKCPKCHKTFVTKNLYEWHGCLIKNNSKCPRCNKFFAKRLNLQRHVVECNDKIIETEPVFAEAKNNRSDTIEVEAFTSNDGKKIVKVEPGSILEIEDESDVAVSNTNDDDAQEMEDSVEDDVGFQDDHEDETEDTTITKTSTIVNVSTEINNLKNLDKNSSDIIAILDDSDSIPIRPIKQEKVDRRYDEVICRASTANIPMVQIKQEIFNTDYINQVDLNILRNIKPEPVESATESNNAKNVCSASVSECPNQSNKVVAAKPTLKLKIKKEHGTLNSSFIDSDLGEGGDSSPNPNRSNDDESGTSHHRKKRNKHKKKIYKIPKQLALIIKQEKQNRDDRDSSIPEDNDMDSRITVPVISEVTSIAESVLETANTINQLEYYEEQEISLSVCVSGQSQEITEDVDLSVGSGNEVQIPVIAEVVSLTQPEPCLPLISSVTSLSQSSGIRVKMEFSNFASPRPESHEQLMASDRRIEPYDMITGSCHMDYNTDHHLEHTESEEVTLSTSKDDIEPDIEVKPNLDVFNALSEITSKTIQDSTAVVAALGQISSSDLLTDIANTSIKSTDNDSSKKLSELSTDVPEKNLIAVQVNQITALYMNDPNKPEKPSENEKTSTEELVSAVTEAHAGTSQDIVIPQMLSEINPTDVKDSTDKVYEECEMNSEINMKPCLQPSIELIKPQVHKTEELENYVSSDDVLKYNPDIVIPIAGINIIQKNIDSDETKSAVSSKLDIEQQHENIVNLKAVSTNTADSFEVIPNFVIRTNVIDLVQSKNPDNNYPAIVNPDMPNKEFQEIICETTNSTVIHKLDIEKCYNNIENVNQVIISTVDRHSDTALDAFKSSQPDLIPTDDIPDNENPNTENSGVIVSEIQEKDNCDESNSTVIHKVGAVHQSENIKNVNPVIISTVDRVSGNTQKFDVSELDLIKSNEISDNDDPKIEKPYVSVIQEKTVNVESNSTVIHKLDPAEHYQYIGNVTPVSIIIEDNVSAIDNNDFETSRLDLVPVDDISDKNEFKAIQLDLVENKQIFQNIENNNTQSEYIHTEINKVCHETSFQNVQIELGTDCDTKANEPIDLVLSSQINLHVETAKRQLDLDDNTEETKHKIQKISVDCLDRDDAIEVKDPLEFRLSHIMDEIIQFPQDSSVIKSSKTVSEPEKHDNIEVHCNEHKMEEERRHNTQFSEDDADSQTKSNIFDVPIENTNNNNTIHKQLIKTDICDDTSFKYAEESDSITTKQDIIDLKNRFETVETDSQNVQTCNIIEKKTNEEYDYELMKCERNVLFSTSKDETDRDNKPKGNITLEICDPIQDMTSNNNMEGERSINDPEKYAVTGLELSMDVKEDSSILIQNKSDIRMQEVPMIIPMTVQDDLEHDTIEPRIQYDEEDSFNKIPQLINFPIKDEELSAVSEDQHQDENLTDEDIEMSDEFQSENDINMEKDRSSITYEVKQDLLHDKDLKRQYIITSTEQIDQIVEDNSHKSYDDNFVQMDDEELSITSVPQYQLCGNSNKQCNVGISDSESVIDSSNKMKDLYNINTNNEESILTQRIKLRHEEYLEEIISNKNKNENLNLIKSGEVLSNIIELSNYGEEKKSSDGGVMETIVHEKQHYPVLQSELDEISDESCASPTSEKLSDAQLHEYRIHTPEIIESSSSSMITEDNLGITLENVTPLDDSKKSEDVFDPNSVFNTSESQSSDGELMKTTLLEDQHYPVLHSELDEISDESCASSTPEKLSDAQLHEDRTHTSEIIESGSSSRITEENLSIKLESRTPLVHFKKSEVVYDPHSVSNTPESQSLYGKLMKTTVLEEQHYPVLHSELDEISDESCASPTSEKLSDAQLHEDRIRSPEIIESGSSSMITEENLSITLESDTPLDDLNKSKDICDPNLVSPDTNIMDISYVTTKQIQEFKKSEVPSCNSMEVASEKSLDLCVDSTSNNIEIEIKDYLHRPVAIMDISETSSNSLEASQTEINTIIGCINTSNNLVIENAEIIQNTISEFAAELQTNDTIATIEPILEKNQNISSNAILKQITSSPGNLNDNLDNTTNLSTRALETNLTDSIIYNAVENEEEIDSDLEKELLEETHESVK